MTATIHNSVTDAMSAALGAPREYDQWDLMDSDSEIDVDRTVVCRIDLGSGREWTVSRSETSMRLYLITDLPHPVDGRHAPHPCVYVMDCADNVRALADYLEPDSDNENSDFLVPAFEDGDEVLAHFDPDEGETYLSLKADGSREWLTRPPRDSGEAIDRQLATYRAALQTQVPAAPHEDDLFTMAFSRAELKTVLEAGQTVIYGNGFDGDDGHFKRALEAIGVALEGDET